MIRVPGKSYLTEMGQFILRYIKEIAAVSVMGDVMAAANRKHSLTVDVIVAAAHLPKMTSHALSHAQLEVVSHPYADMQSNSKK